MRLLALLLIVAYIASATTLLFLPIDERFTTRDAFINLARTTPYNILTPPKTLLPQIRVAPNIKALDEWLDTNIAKADIAVISLETFIFGGLIQSRISNVTSNYAQQRLQSLVNYKKMYPNVKLYISSTVMRIENSTINFEDVWYWDPYGIDFFQYSWYHAKYLKTGQKEYEELASEFSKKIPQSIFSDYLWRRKRNFNLSKRALECQNEWKTKYNSNLFETLVVTLDDNAAYGLNILESDALKKYIDEYNLPNLVYPGADEVGLTLLARATSNVQGVSPVFKVVYRDPKTMNYIPNFEGQSMALTLNQHVVASGGQLMKPGETEYDVILLVNNFNRQHQLEAANQPIQHNLTDYATLASFVKTSKPIGLVDNRFSNGADLGFISWMRSQHVLSKNTLNMDTFAYAGWNTNGNTVGTVVANVITLHFFKSPAANKIFNSLRILEDAYYQSLLRQDLVAYVDQVHGDSIAHLNDDIDFYTRYSFKRLNSNFMDITTTYGVDASLKSIYYPWHRTFEIGFETSQKK